MLFCWYCSKMATRILIFFNCHGCQTFILADIHCYLSALKSYYNIFFLSGVKIGKISVAQGFLVCTFVRQSAGKPFEYYSITFRCGFKIDEQNGEKEKKITQQYTQPIFSLTDQAPCQQIFSQPYPSYCQQRLLLQRLD